MFSTFLLDLAEASMQIIPSFVAKVSASSLVTCLSPARSHLFPTKTLTVSRLLYFSIYPIQFWMSWKLFLSQRSKTRMMPCAPLQQAEVMVLNFSCPAVSHICSFTMLPSCSKVRILKSTPMVGQKDSWKRLSENLRRRLDFPTDELPMRRVLKTQSQSVEAILFVCLQIKSNIIVFLYQISVLIRKRGILTDQLRFLRMAEKKKQWTLEHQLQKFKGYSKEILA